MFLVIAILFGAFLTICGLEVFVEELRQINENLAVSFSMSLFGLIITIVACFIFKKFLLED
jgi:hypothetical protein